MSYSGRCVCVSLSLGQWVRLSVGLSLTASPCFHFVFDGMVIAIAAFAVLLVAATDRSV